MSRLLPRLALAAAFSLVALGGAVAPATAATTGDSCESGAGCAPPEGSSQGTLARAAPVTFDYGVTGTVSVATLIRGSLQPEGSSTLSYTFQGEAHAVSGTLNLGQATSRLVALDFIPVTAKVGFVSSGPATGVYGGFLPAMWLTQKVRIKVLEAKLFGAIPLSLGNTCQSKQLTDLSLYAISGFSPTKGGTLPGTFTISDLNGCGALNGLVSSATAGDGNTISVKLSPR